MKKRAIFVCSQKGGAGKTTFARGLVELLRCEGYVVAAYDADGNVGQLFQHEGLRDANGRLIPNQDPLVGCGFFNIREDDDRDILLNALAAEPPLILFDLPGGVVGELGKVVDYGAAPRGLFSEYLDRGYAITVVVVMTPVLASVRTVQESIESFGHGVDYVAVKNLAFGAEENFILFDGCAQPDLTLPTSVGKQMLLAQGGALITMPALHSRSYALLDVFNLSYLAAAQGSGPGRRLPLADQMRVRRWLQEFDEQLVPAQHRLGFAAITGDEAASTHAPMPAPAQAVSLDPTPLEPRA
jgi:hypothetical protein